MENNILKNMKFKFDVEPFYSGDKPSGFKIVVSDLRQKTALAKHIKHGGEVVKSFYYKEKWTIEYDSHSKLFTALIPETYKADDGNREIIWTPYPIDEDDIVNIFKIDMRKLRNIYKTTQVDSIIKEDIDSFEVIQDGVELNNISISEARKLFLEEFVEEMGYVLSGSVLVDNVIYQLWDYFETYITDDDTILDEPREIPYGIFFIIEFVPGKITMYNPTAKGIEDVDSIGKKPFSYFKGSEWAVFSNLSDFLNGLNEFFGKGFLNFDNTTTSQENLEAMWEAAFNSSTVNESAGDVKLRKFLFGKTKKDDKKFPKQSKYYNNELGGYLIVWEYNYNTLTRDSEDKDWSHSEMKKKLPYELQQIITYNDGSSWGREDYYETHTGLFISDGMSDEDEAVLRNILKNKFLTTLKLNEDENDELEVIDDEVQIRSATPNEIMDLVGDKTLEELEDELGIDSLLGEYSAILDNFDLEDLAEWISYDKAYNSKRRYIRDRIHREFIKSPSVHDGVFEFLMTAEDIEKSSRDMSLDFIHACFRGDVFEYFYGYGPGDIDASYYIDELDEDSLKKLEALGFSKEMVEKSVSGDYEEDEPNAAYMDDLQAAISRAASEGLRVGAEAEALSSFESAFESALPIGTSFNKKSENWDDEKRPILITADFIKENFITVWDRVDYSGNSVVDLVVGAFKELFNDNFNFYEPRYGFDGFDADVFNDYFKDIVIEELESEMQRGNK